MHAHRCPKLQNNGQCDLAACQDPNGVVEYCKTVLKSQSWDIDNNVKTCSKILMHHSLSCGNPQHCKMLLCKHFRFFFVLFIFCQPLPAFYLLKFVDNDIYDVYKLVTFFAWLFLGFFLKTIFIKTKIPEIFLHFISFL